jgi:acyl carrier protein
MQQDAQERIMAYLRGAADVAAADVDVMPDTPLLETGLLDSMGLVGLVRFLEQEFGIEIPDEDMGPELFESPAALAGYIARRRAA